MSATIPDIANALAAAIGTIDGLRTLPFLADVITPPVALIAWEEVSSYHGAFGYSDVEHTFTVHLIVGRASERAGIEAMEAFASPSGSSSIRAAIEADNTLGSVVSTCIVDKSGPPGQLTVAGLTYLWLPFTVLVHA